MINEDEQHRFSGIRGMEPFDPETGRININVEHEVSREGVKTQGMLTFTALKDTSGQWYLANID
ncbi:hypothetical protein SY83_03740 [Paenibacillus swuensis]|uniref:Uncharacterized protein n=1 Tax=Paenibacillus swuensis TaxID=1178515 RepID=A0A172TF79_9BACL|nr:hypothetical protein [Paenibacillus swuensis]ANE45564.1 hypothetical protein SY83_03740 [Paenibacillus swuensis]